MKGTSALHVSIIITNPFCPLLFCPRLTPSRPLFPRFVVIKLRRRSGALSPCLSWASAPASPLVSLDWSSVTLLPAVLSDFGGHSSLAGACQRLVPMHQWCCKASAAKGRDGQTEEGVSSLQAQQQASSSKDAAQRETCQRQIIRLSRCISQCLSARLSIITQ